VRDLATVIARHRQRALGNNAVASGAEIKAVSVWASVTHTDLDLGVRQAARLPLATRRAAQKMRMLQSSTEAEALVRASQRAPTVAQRIMWLHEAATAWGKPVEAVAACAKGCAHCCHIPVTISGKEAQLVSRATGRAAVATPRNSVSVQDLTEVDTVALASEKLTHWGTGTACPFLVSDTCSIYEIRPLACRVLFNMDDDDLLCRHGAQQPADVPYAYSRILRALALAAQPAETLADIRDFFPAPSTS